MCPLTPASLASVYDTEFGVDGKLYIAQYVDGQLCWVCTDNSDVTEGLPATPACFASVYATEFGVAGKLYIAQYVDGQLCWVCMDNDSSTEKTKKSRKSNKSKRNTSNKYPSIPLECVSTNDVHIGEDGNSYIARMVKGKMSWSLHTQTYGWNTTTNINITITHDDLSNCLQSSEKSSEKKSRRRSSKKT